MPVQARGPRSRPGGWLCCAAAPHVSGLTPVARDQGGDAHGSLAPSLLFQKKAPARTHGLRRGPQRVRRCPPPTPSPHPPFPPPPALPLPIVSSSLQHPVWRGGPCGLPKGGRGFMELGGARSVVWKALSGERHTELCFYTHPASFTKALSLGTEQVKRSPGSIKLALCPTDRSFSGVRAECRKRARSGMGLFSSWGYLSLEWKEWL